MKEPAVSVCIPTRDQGRHLAKALESVFQQTTGDFEIVVYDDASTDDTRRIVIGFCDARLRYFRHRRPVGIAFNRNACLGVARGRYIAWLDSDDVYEPWMLERQRAVLERNAGVGLVHGGFTLIDQEDRPLKGWPPVFDEDVVEPGLDAFPELVLANYIVAPTVMVRRACHDTVGRYAARIGESSTDWEMWLRIALHADLAYTAEPVARYRLHEASVSARTARNTARLACDRRVVSLAFSRNRGLIPDPGSLERRARAALAVRALAQTGKALAEGRRKISFVALAEAGRAFAPMTLRPDAWQLAAAIARGDEYSAFRHARTLLTELRRELVGTRFGASPGSLARSDPAWESTLAEIAGTLRRVVPREATIAAVDKCDPTLLHLSGRKGRHFPDPRLRPGGAYPRDSGEAIEHLEEQRHRGVRYLVFPSAAFWWLEFYEDFRRHLETRYQRVWSDEQCLIYRIVEPDGTVAGIR